MQTALQSWMIERIKPQDGIDADSAAELDRGADGTAELDKTRKTFDDDDASEQGGDRNV